MEFGRFAWLVLLVCFGLCFSSTQGYRFYVGGRDGWVLNPSENYIQWSGRNRFQVNNTLYFKYKKGTDSVLVVNKDDYFKCNTKNPIQKLDGGDSEFTLDRSGPFYFISGQDGNCDKGQKLSIVVLAVRHHNKPNPPTVAPTTPPSTSPTSPSPKSPSPQYPHHPPGTSPQYPHHPPGTSPSPAPVGYPPATSPSPVGYPPATTPSPVGYPPATSPSPVRYPPATSPSPSTSSPGLAPVPSSSPTLTPSLSPPSPPPEGFTPAPSSESAGPTPPGTVASPPPGTADSTAPVPAGSGASHSVTAPSSVLVASAVVFISVALMSSFVQGGAV